MPGKEKKATFDAPSDDASSDIDELQNSGKQASSSQQEGEGSRSGNAWTPWTRKSMIAGSKKTQGSGLNLANTRSASMQSESLPASPTTKHKSKGHTLSFLGSKMANAISSISLSRDSLKSPDGRKSAQCYIADGLDSPIQGNKEGFDAAARTEESSSPTNTARNLARFSPNADPNVVAESSSSSSSGNGNFNSSANNSSCSNIAANSLGRDKSELGNESTQGNEFFSTEGASGLSTTATAATASPAAIATVKKERNWFSLSSKNSTSYGDETLNLNYHGVSALKPTLNLRNVTILLLNHNNFTAVPSEVCMMGRLRHIGFNEISTLPKGIADLASLEVLNLCENKITTEALEAISWHQMKSMHTLLLINNQIKKIPLSITSAELVTLSFTGNQICEIPASMSRMKRLQWLGLSNNQITRVSPLFGILTLQGISLAGNPLTDTSELELQRLHRLAKASNLMSTVNATSMKAR